jgi:DNA topoisomerase-1
MAKKTDLLIVESPAKARTIARFLGERFELMSSMGHVADLPRKGMSIDIENGFTPAYEVSADKRKVIAGLRKAVKTAERVWLASDEDREGEAIAWHLARVLRLKPAVVRRIVFHEITKPAIERALEHPRTIDQHLVDAQQARRVLDRLVGYELSPVLWKKVMPGLSAGRVQSVAVRLVVEREREIDKFEPVETFKVSGEFDSGTGTVPAKLDRDFEIEAAARAFLEKARTARFTVSAREQKPAKRSSRPPFTTSTLQQEASQKLGFSVKQTMALAQRLYESGRITYMRTDSVTMSELAIGQAAKVIAERFGKDYSQVRRYRTKAKGAQEAHEAIRPTDFGRDRIDGERNEQRLYELVHRRALASQMADARIQRTTATIEVSTADERFLAKGEVVTFPGFLAAYGDGDADEKALPPLKQGQELVPREILARQSFTRSPARYTEASLVKRLEELGIGRPSTYAPTISTIQTRGYVEKRSEEGREREYRVLVLRAGEIEAGTRTEKVGAGKAKLFPTDVAGVVIDFLIEHFSGIMDYDFTARIEQELDEIADGEKVWNDMVAGFYGPFHRNVEKAEGLSRAEVAQQRELGTDPKTGKPVSARFGRYGPFVQIGTKDDEEKPRFASLRKGQKVETITLDEAMELFKLPRVLGETPEGEEVAANFGRFGPYVRYGSKFVSIKDGDPLDITLEQALALIAAKKAEDARRQLKVFDGSDIRVLEGRWGPYVTDGSRNAKVPKGTEPGELTLEDCQKLIAAAPVRKRRGAARKTTGKPSAKKRPVKKRATRKPVKKKPAKKAGTRKRTKQ